MVIFKYLYWTVSLVHFIIFGMATPVQVERAKSMEYVFFWSFNILFTFFTFTETVVYLEKNSYFVEGFSLVLLF